MDTIRQRRQMKVTLRHLPSLKVLVVSLVLMPRRGEAKWDRPIGATVAIELRHRNGGLALMVRSRYVTIAV